MSTDTRHAPILTEAFQTVSRIVAEAVHLFSESRRASAECQRLLRLSDAELAARGLTRQSVVQHVAKNSFAI